jgi:hypothetical protein
MKQGATARESEETALRLIRAALGPLGFVETTDRDSGADVSIRLADGKTLMLEMKHDSSPRVPHERADAAVYVLRRATRRRHDEFRRAGRSFVDVSGTVYLSLPNVLIDRTGVRVPTRRGLVQQRFDPFADRSSLVARVLLETAGDERTWGVRELADAAAVSPATATRAIREMEGHGVQVQRRGRNAAVRLRDGRALFAAWTRAYDWTRNPSVAFNAPMGDPNRFLGRMAREWTGPRWALAMHAGAARVAPHSTWTRAHLYVEVPDGSALVEVGEAQGWEPAEGGNVVLLKPWYRTSVWHGLREVAGLPVVSALQLALDLWHFPLRGREQAEHLIDTMGLGGSADAAG